MNEIADIQAQLVALSMAVEGTWLSLLSSDPNALENAKRLRTDNVKAVAQIAAGNAEQRAMRDAVERHVDRLWGSIEWQIENRAAG